MDDAAIELATYDPSWPDRFVKERDLIAAALAPWLVGEPEHIGSTAVPGLAAKPVIDIMAPVRTLDGSLPAIKHAETLGYMYFPYKPEAMHWFCKPSPAARTHHLHLVPFGSDLWHERLTFRNILRSDPEHRLHYEALKLRLGSLYREDRDAYTEAKGPFIRRVLKRAARRWKRVPRTPSCIGTGWEGFPSTAARDDGGRCGGKNALAERGPGRRVHSIRHSVAQPDVGLRAWTSGMATGRGGAHATSSFPSPAVLPRYAVGVSWRAAGPVDKMRGNDGIADLWRHIGR